MQNDTIEIMIDKVNVDLERGTVVLTGFDINEIISEIGWEELLNSMDYSDILEYVTEIENDKRDEYDINRAADL